MGKIHEVKYWRGERKREKAPELCRGPSLNLSLSIHLYISGKKLPETGNCVEKGIRTSFRAKTGAKNNVPTRKNGEAKGHLLTRVLKRVLPQGWGPTGPRIKAALDLW